MIEGILGLIGGIAGTAINAGWKQAELDMAHKNLQWQKEIGTKQFNLASAGRTDAYGNKQKYNQLLNEWELAMTPKQKQIVSAGETEQLRSLTEDAARNRKIRERQAKRGDIAAEDYNKARAAYQFDQPKSELAIRCELQGLLNGISQSNVAKNVTELTRDSLRKGKGAMLPQILQAGQRESSADWAKNLLQAKQQGQQEYQARVGAHESKYLPMLAKLQETMDMGGDMPQRFSTEPQRLAQEQGQQTSTMLQALQAQAAATNQAAAIQQKAADGGPVDLKGLAAMLGKFGGTGGGQTGGSRTRPQQDVLVDNFGSF